MLASYDTEWVKLEGDKSLPTEFYYVSECNRIKLGNKHRNISEKIFQIYSSTAT